MKKILVIATLWCGLAHAQTDYDSRTLVDTNNSSTSTSTVNSISTTSNSSNSTSDSNINSVSNNTNTSTNINTNNNINSGTQTLNNNNVNSGTMTYNNNNANSGSVTYNNNNVNSSTSASTAVNTNNNVNSGTMTYNNNNMSASTSTNVNQNTSTAVNQNVQTGDMTNRNINDTTITQKVIQPPPTAIAPAMMSGGNADLCSTGTSGSVQTQIFGVSGGGTVRDMNCERLKLSKTLYDMGMKVAAVATMCQDRRVFDAMLAAGTPCPFEGQIGAQAKAQWDANPDKLPKQDEVKTDDTYKKLGIGALLGAIIFKAF